MSTKASPAPGGAVLEFTLGDRLRKARTYANMTAEELGTLLGVSGRTITNHEQPDWPVRRQTIIAWAMATGVSFDWLLYGIETGDGGPDQGIRQSGCIHGRVLTFPIPELIAA